MIEKNFITNHNIDIDILQSKRPQTEYKIQYIKEYVLYWLKISVNRQNIKFINFIDCMCNAGIYQDEDFCTSIEVLKLFIKEAPCFPEKKFYLYLNDFNEERIRVTQTIVNIFLNKEEISNVFVSYDTKDVNEYINDFSLFDKTLNSSSSSILFVDPYNMRSVKINAIREFIKKYYCEVIFNVITSDFNRNKTDHKIFELLENKYEITSVDKLMNFIIKRLKIGKMKYCFSYSFYSMKNLEIYQILFLTPNIRGLEKLKEALRLVFKGMEKYKNKSNIIQAQGELFTLDESNVEENVLLNCGKETQTALCQYYSGQTISFKEIECFVLEKSVLADYHIIKYVLEPLIKENKIRKCNITSRKSNFKDDEYEFYQIQS